MNNMKLLVFKPLFSNKPIIMRLSASSIFFNIFLDLQDSSSFYLFQIKIKF